MKPLTAMCLLLGLIAGELLIASPSGQAADVTWTNFAGLSTWDSSSQAWSTGGNVYLWNNTNNDGALFTGLGAGSLTVSQAISAQSLDFVANGYSLAGPGTLTLTAAGGSTAGPATIQVGTGQSATVGVVLAGSNGLTVAGNGQLILTGTNTYTGGTTITGGTLSISADANLGDPAGSVTLRGGALQATQSFTLGAGRLVLLGQLAGAGGGTIDVAGGQTLTVAGLVQNNGTGTGSLTKTGAGTLLLNNTGIWTGGTTISGGILRLGAAQALPGQSAVALANSAGAGLDLNSFNVTLLSLDGGGSNGGTVQLGSGTLTVGGGTYNGVLSGSGSLVKQGPATFTLGGANLYTGTTTVQSGVLQVSADNNLGAVPGSFTANTITLDAGTLSATSTFTLNANRGITLTPVGGTLSVAANQTLTYGGVIQGTGSLTLSGGGTLILGGINTYTGGTTISAGTLQLGAATTLPSATALTFAPLGSGGLNLNNFNLTLASLSGGQSSMTVNLGSGTLTVGNTTSTTFSGSFLGSGNLVKVGSGTLTLNSASTFTGTTTVNHGTLAIAADNYLGSVPASSTPGAVVLNGGTLGAAGLGFTLAANRGITLGPLGGTISAPLSGMKIICNSPISGVGGLTLFGSGEVDLNATNTFTGGLTVNTQIVKLLVANAIPTNVALTMTAGTLDLGGMNTTIGSLSGAGGNITLGAGILTFGDGTNAQVHTGFFGSGGLVKQGSGTVQLFATSAYTGPTTINAGTLSIQNDNCLGIAPSSPTINSLVINGATLSSSLDLSLNPNRGVTIGPAGATFLLNNGHTWSYPGALAGAGDFTIAGSGSISLGGTSTQTGNITIGNGIAVTITVAAGSLPTSASYTVQIGGTLSLDNSINFVNNNRLNDSAPLTLNGANFLMVGNSTTSSSETVGTLTLGVGPNVVNLTQGNPGVTTNLTIGASGGTSLSARPAGATVLFTNTGTTLGSILMPGTVPGTGNILGGFALFTGTTNGVTSTDWAVLNGGVLQGLTSYQTSPNASTWSSTDNVKVNAALTVNPSNATINSLYLNNFNTITQTGTLTVNSGGIYANASSTLTGGSVRSGLPVAAGGDLIVTVSNGNTFTLGASIIDFGANHTPLTKTGAGTLQLTGSNSYSGGTYINQGILSIAGDGSLGAAGTAVTLSTNAGSGSNSSATLAFTASATLGVNRPFVINGGTSTVDTSTFNVVIPNAISGSGGLQKNGTGTLTLTGLNTYTGATNANAGTLTLGATGALPSGTTLTLGTGATVDLNGFNLTVNNLTGNFNSLVKLSGATLTIGTTGPSPPVNYTGVIGGNGTVNIQGPLSMEFSGVNTYTGTTQLLSGSNLQINADSGLGTPPASPTPGSLIFDGGTLNANNGLTLNPNRGISVTGNGATIGVTIVQTLIANGTLSGTGTVSVIGPGTLALGGTNDFTGAFNLKGGGLSISSDANLGAVPTVPTNTVYLGINGTLQATGSFTLNANRTLVLEGGTITVASNQTLQVPGKVTTDLDSGGILTKSGAGTLVLGGSSNDYTGGTTVSAGTLQLGAANALPTSTALSVANTAGAVLDLNSFNQTVGSLNGGGSTGGAILLGSGTLTVGNAAASSFGGVISGTGGLLVQGSSLTLTGTNLFSGGTAVTNGGSVTINADSNLGAASGGLTLNGGTLTINSSLTLASSRAVTLGPAGGTFNASGGTLTYNGTITGPGSLALTGSFKTITLGGQSTYGGNTTVSNQVALTVDNALPASTALIFLTTNSFTLDAQGHVETVASLSGGGSGTTYSLGVSIPGGTLKVGDATSTTFAGNLSGTGTMIKQGNGTLTLAGISDSGLTARWVLNGGALKISSDVLLGQTISSSSATPDTFTFNGGTLSTTNSFTLNALRGMTLGTGGTLAVASGTTLTYAGPITGSGSLTLSGPGTLALGGAGTSNYTGPTYLNGGTLTLTTANGLSTATTVVFSDTSAATWNLSSQSQTVAGLAGGAGGGSITLGSGSLTLNNSGQSVFTGSISGTGGLTRTGNGVQTLAGTNLYTGPTQVQGGVLLINGSTAAGSTVTVSGGVLGGSGTINGPVTVNGTGTITAGSQFVPGTLNTGALSFSGGSYQWKVAQMPSAGAAGTDWDLLHINGALTLGAGTTVMIAAPSGVAGWNPTPATAQQWAIATFTGGLNGNLANVGVDSSLFALPVDPSYGFFLTSDSSTLYANYYLYTPVPEPGAIFLLAAAVVAVGWRWPSRKRGYGSPVGGFTS